MAKYLKMSCGPCPFRQLTQHCQVRLEPESRMSLGRQSGNLLRHTACEEHPQGRCTSTVHPVLAPDISNASAREKKDDALEAAP